MTTVIIPTRGRPDLLIRCMNSLFSADALPSAVWVIHDDDEGTLNGGVDFVKIHDHHAKIRRSGGRLRFLVNDVRLGFWQSINEVLARIPSDEPFCYFGKDVVFATDWLENAERMWADRFPDGLGLLTFRDGIQDGANASHGMTTKRWLYVVNGEERFPSEYFHHHCDSEITNRNRDLGRYAYCAESFVEHKHEPTGHDGEVNRGGAPVNDYALQNTRHYQWVGSGLAEARLRLSEAA